MLPWAFTDCAEWDVPAAPSQVAKAVTSDVPVLLTSGAFDGTLPPSYGRRSREDAEELHESRVPRDRTQRVALGIDLLRHDHGELPRSAQWLGVADGQDRRKWYVLAVASALRSPFPSSPRAHSLPAVAAANNGIGLWLINSIALEDYAAIRGATLVVAGVVIFISVSTELLTTIIYPARRKELYAKQD